MKQSQSAAIVLLGGRGFLLSFLFDYLCLREEINCQLHRCNNGERETLTSMPAMKASSGSVSSSPSSPSLVPSLLLSAHRNSLAILSRTASSPSPSGPPSSSLLLSKYL